MTIAEHENLMIAVWRASRGKADRHEVISFRSKLIAELDYLRQHIVQGAMFKFEYRSFEVHDPKPRLIRVAPFRVRVLHHAIINVIGAVLEEKQYAHSYACLNGRGTHAALRYVRSTISANGWYLKMDVRKFFDSVTHEILLAQLIRVIKDQRVLSLLRDIITSYETAHGCGLPIGNLTSQYLANHYLTPLDNYIKQELKVKYYVRYMDDILIYNLDKDQLKLLRTSIISYATNHLRLEFKVAQINAISRGIPFLGMRIFLDKMRLSAVGTRRFKKRWKTLNELVATGRMSEQEAAKRLNAVMAFALHAKTVALRRKLMSYVADHD